jgi:hypothetical protein
MHKHTHTQIHTYTHIYIDTHTHTHTHTEKNSARIAIDRSLYGKQLIFGIFCVFGEYLTKNEELF